MTSLESLHNLIPINLASLSFVYVLLPICLLVFYLVPKRLRPSVLLVSSVGFYFLAEPRHLFICTGLVIINYLFVLAVVMLASPKTNLFRARKSVLAEDKERNGCGGSPLRVQKSALAENKERDGSGGSPLRKIFMLAAVIFNLFALGYFSVLAQLGKTAPPLGLLVMSVSAIDAVLEAYREKEPQSRNIIRFSLYLMFFPRLYAGPLANPQEFYANCGNVRYNAEAVLTGFGRFAEGLIKYAAIGRSLFFLYESIREIPAAEVSVLSAWILVFAFAFALYFTFSGIADIARGVAGMFGIPLPQNFYYPYQARSISDFFERFNMTVGSFLKNRVLTPLSPDPAKSDSVADGINIVIVGMLWGLWFGVRINCFIWGIFIAVFLIMEKYFYPRLLEAVPTLFRRFYTFLIVVLSFALFAGDSFSASLLHVSHMFGAGGIDLFNGRILYLLSMNWVLLILAAILSTSLISLLVSAARKAFPKASMIGLAVIDVSALILFTSLTLGGGVL